MVEYALYTHGSVQVGVSQPYKNLRMSDDNERIYGIPVNDKFIITIVHIIIIELKTLWCL